MMPGEFKDDDLSTVIIATCNRGSSIVATIKSIFASDHQNIELIIVDQSKNDDTQRAIEPFLADERLRYFRSSITGLGRARTQGLMMARSEYCCITDDDCEVATDWISKMTALLRDHPKVAVVFSTVAAAPYDETKGFIPAYTHPGEITVTNALGKCGARGIGAGMAVKRSPSLGMGGFDSSLGPGSRFPCCDDCDLAVRLLMTGYHIMETDRTSVLHHGFRTFEQGRSLTKRDFLGIGAAYSKQVKAGRFDFMVIPVYEFCFVAVWPLIWSALRLKRPRGFARPVYFLKGFFEGLQQPIDKKTLLWKIDHPDFNTGLTQYPAK